MALIGQTVGPYQITSKLGEGGMGEVYKALDNRLNRTVAIKVLQASVSADHERIARFEREAQILASLQHPNIAGIHGLEQAQGATYLVLEFVDGKPLDTLIGEGGAIPGAEAAVIARQIADAIAAAHEKGIIHRDLKPANVMLTADGQVKVLDFGLGKSLDDGRPAPGESAPSNSPTITIGSTQAGIVLGTAGYMSPEQAKGRAADRRSDVWSFGCLLFEMLAGTRAFDGEDVTDTIAAIVRGEPNWKALPATTPPPLRQLIERCLIKDRTQRLADMSVVRYVLSERIEAGSSVPPADLKVRPPTGPSPLVAVALVGLAMAGTALAMYFWSGAAPQSVTNATNLARYTVVLPEGDEVLPTNLGPLAITADGRSLVYSGRQTGKQLLFVHDFATGQTTALEGTDGGYSPFVSPDGRWIGFFARAKLRKITLGGTSLQELADVAQARGGSWGSDDNIYYAPSNVSGIWKVPVAGGTAVELTRLDPNASEISHRNPYVLPDARALLFLVWTGPGADEHRIEYLSLADGKRQVVVANTDGPVSVVNGHLVWTGRNDTLLSAPWDPARANLQGVEPRVLPFHAAMENEGVSAYAASETGTFVHLKGDAQRRLARVVWVDQQGTIEPLPLPDRDYVSATISPDGTRAAIQSRGGIEELWIYDFRTKSFTPFVTGSGSTQAPLWTIDSTYLIYRGTRKGTRNLYRKAADGSGSEERLTTKPDVTQTPYAASPDGKWILFNESGTGARGGSDVWKLELDGARGVSPVLTSTAAEIAAQISPNGRWLSFDSDVSGTAEIWVQPIAGSGGAMRQVSHGGGSTSIWSRDGQELFYTTAAGVMAVAVSGDSFSTPRRLFPGRFRITSNSNTNYDVARDGRFLMVQQIEPSRAQTRIEVVLNGLRR